MMEPPIKYDIPHRVRMELLKSYREWQKIERLKDKKECRKAYNRALKYKNQEAKRNGNNR